MHRFTFALIVAAVPGVAYAQETGDPAPTPAQPDHVEAPSSARSRDVERPWLYNDDPTVPAQWHAVLSLRDTVSGNDRSVTRPFASQQDGLGGQLGVDAQVGLHRVLALDVSGVVGGFGDSVAGGMTAGLRLAPFADARHGFRLAIAAGYLRDLDAQSGFYARLAASYDVGRLRLSAMAHGEHVFRSGADALDVFATVGASVRLHRVFRLGVEYVVQDIEEAWASEPAAALPGAAEGGVHQFLGVGGSLVLLDNRLFINLGPALALSYATVAPVGRAVVSYSF